MHKKAVFFHSLSQYLHGGISVIESLRSEQSPGFVHVGNEMADAITAGQTLSQAAESSSGRFNSLEISMMKVGEKTGQLDAIFKMLSDWVERVNKLRKQLIGSLIMPVIYIHAFAFLTPFPNFFLGKITAVDYFELVGMILVMPYLLMLLFGLLIPKMLELEMLPGRPLLMIPIAGKFMINLNMCRFLNAYSFAMNAGASAAESVEIAAGACSNVYIRKKMLEVSAKIAQSKMSFTEAASGVSFIPPIVLEFLKTGEATGKSIENSLSASQILEEKIESFLHRMGALIPMVVFGIVALVIGIYIIDFFRDYVNQIKDLL